MIDLDNLIKESMKAHDTVSLTAYRNLKTEIQKYKTSKGAKPLTEAKQLEIFSKYAKTLEDSIKQFSEVGRTDLELGYTVELEVVKKLLPEPVSSIKINKFLQKYAHENGFVTAVLDNGAPYPMETFEVNIPKKNMGDCIKYIKANIPTADGKLVSDIVRQHLV